MFRCNTNNSKVSRSAPSGWSSSNCWWRVMIIAVALIMFLVFLPTAYCRKTDSDDSPKSRLETKPEWNRTKSKSSECRLGGSRFSLNDTWSPDLGPPFGVWKCVKCTCTPVQKKKRIVAKVLCRNIKTECPIAKCQKPVLSPGACCKWCPGEEEFNDYVMEEPESETLSGKDFAVLLNGRTTRSPQVTLSLATGRIFLRRGTLHFSFVLGKNTSSPSTIQFMTEEGDILEELEAQPTPYEVNNGRVCGTWTRVPRQYREVLLQEKMWVALVNSDEEDIINGRIARYKGVNTEAFSSLLAPSKNDSQTLPGGGTAIISVSAPSDSLHISLVFNGIFKSSDERNVSVVIELRPSRTLDPVQDTVVLQKVYSDINEAEVRTTLGETSLRLLTRGKVFMKVWSTESPEFGLEGDIIARATCNVFRSVMTSTPEANAIHSPPELSYGAGWGLLFLSNEGDFQYQMKLEGLPTAVKKVVLQTVVKRKVRDVEDITTSFRDGWVNGTYSRPTYRDLEALFRDKLQVSITLTDERVLDGIFEAVSVTEALRALHPTLLTSSSSWMGATAWVAVDDDCVMHYDIRLAGEDPSGNYDPTWSLQLRENDTTWDPRLDLVNVTLESVITGREVASHTTHLTKISLTRLHAAVTFLDLTVSGSSKAFIPIAVLTGLLTNIYVPPLCLLDTEDVIEGGKQPSMEVEVDSACKRLICLDAEEKPPLSKKCIDDEKRVFDDGKTWKSPINNCARCTCRLGRIKCQDEPCPKRTCPDAVLLTGQCCPSCPVVSGRMSERVCEMDGDFHIIGSFWHPFLAPDGFDLCVTCYCNITSKGEPVVECDRIACPPLDCLESEAAYKDKKSCCPKCPKTTPSPGVTTAATVKDMINEGVMAMSDQQRRDLIIANGGCLVRKVFSPQFPRPNGDVWFPSLSSNSGEKCVICNCKDGKITCDSKKCPRPECKKGKKCRDRKDNFRKTKNLSSLDGIHPKKKNRRKDRKQRYG